jgi:hypothetical protein
MAEAESDNPETERQPAESRGAADGPGAEPHNEASAAPAPPTLPPVEEIGGPKGAEPTRYGDWERKGRCIDV